MFIVRDIMYCKPGKARAMVEKFLALGKISEQMGFGSMRVMTDVSAERYWTVVSEMEVANLEQYTETSRKSMEIKEFQEAMKGYHDLIDHGRREIYQLEK
jgi:heme-degrading monooxygenase HmoA